MSYFSRVTLKPQKLAPERLASLFCDDGYKEHQALWHLFSNDSKADRDFLFRRDDLFQGLRYFVISQREPEDRDGLWVIESKHYKPIVQPGQKLAFSLRVNPVVKRKSDDGKSRRHDVVMDAKRRITSERVEKQMHVLDVAQKEGAEWLAKRAARYGFSTNEEAIRIEAYYQHRSFKKDKRISYSTLDISGELTVDNPDLFVESLTNGIGPAKAFGCGLLLVRKM